MPAAVAEMLGPSLGVVAQVVQAYPSACLNRCSIIRNAGAFRRASARF